MNHQLYTFLALDLARERAEEANRHRLVSVLEEPGSSLTAQLRRPLAQALAFVSRGFAAVVRKLDSCVADDLGRTLAPTE